MARQKFQSNVKLALSLLNNIVSTDSASLNIGAAARIINGCNLWLFAKYVEGFDLTEFDDLGDAKKAQLASLVERFRYLADSVPSDAPANECTVTEARRLLIEIGTLLGLVK
jgi:hypothetical protein